MPPSAADAPLSPKALLATTLPRLLRSSSRASPASRPTTTQPQAILILTAYPVSGAAGFTSGVVAIAPSIRSCRRAAAMRWLRPPGLYPRADGDGRGTRAASAGAVGAAARRRCALRAAPCPARGGGDPERRRRPRRAE